MANFNKLMTTLTLDIAKLKASIGTYGLSKDGIRNVLTVLDIVDEGVQKLSTCDVAKTDAVAERLTAVRDIIRDFSSYQAAERMRASIISQQAYRVAEDAIWFVQLRELATLNTTPNPETPFSNRAASRPSRELLN